MLELAMAGNDKLEGMGCRRSKLLQTMVLLRLGLVRKKVLLFVNSINEGFRLRLFLEAFGIRSAVLNAELPLNSRHHILQVWKKPLETLKKICVWLACASSHGMSLSDCICGPCPHILRLLSLRYFTYATEMWKQLNLLLFCRSSIRASLTTS